jgi:hypothetical protein
MAQFVLTAKHIIQRASGLHIDSGTQITVNIPMMGITPYNLFGNSRCKDQLLQQFRINGIDAPATDAGLYSRGTWDIKMK